MKADGHEGKPIVRPGCGLASTKERSQIRKPLIPSLCRGLQRNQGKAGNDCLIFPLPAITLPNESWGDGGEPEGQKAHSHSVLFLYGDGAGWPRGRSVARRPSGGPVAK